jgi:hypothetical protein
MYAENLPQNGAKWEKIQIKLVKAAKKGNKTL